MILQAETPVIGVFSYIRKRSIMEPHPKEKTMSYSEKNRAVRASSNASQGVVVRRSSAGLGLFAAKDFAKGETVIEYVGNRIAASEAESRPNRYLFRVSTKQDIDGSPRWNTARYANHSCKPNCEAENRGGRIYLVTRRKVSAGEEICYDYGREYVDEFIRPSGCRCRKCIDMKKDPV